MSRKRATAPLAVGTDGSVFINVAELGSRSPQRLLEEAIAQPGELFVGVRLSSAEARQVINRVHDAVTGAAAFAFGVPRRRLPHPECSRRRK